MKKCTNCDGSGWIEDDYWMGDDLFGKTVCPICNGEGVIEDDEEIIEF